MANFTGHTDIRLANGDYRKGRLEVFRHGSWGTVCDDRFENVDAQVCFLSDQWISGQFQKVN